MPRLFFCPSAVYNVDFCLLPTNMADRKEQVRKQDQVTVRSLLGNEVRMTWQISFAKVNHPLASETRYFAVKSVDYGGDPSQTSTQMCAKSKLFHR